jgi:hypothetical protein
MQDYLGYHFVRATHEAVIDFIQRSESGYYPADSVVSIVKANISKIVRNATVKLKQRLIDNFIRDVRRYYSVDATRIIRSGEEFAEIKMIASLGNLIATAQGVRLTKDGNLVASVVINPKAVEQLIKETRPTITIGPQGLVSATFLGRPGIVSLFIPAERIVILPALSEVLNFILLAYRSFEEMGRERPRLRQPLFEYLQHLNSSIRSGLQLTDALELGRLKILGREILFEDSTHRVVVPLSATGSGVAQVAGILIPLSSMTPDFLVIEEPEINLHADAVLQIGKYLGSLSRKTQLLVTTHSHYLLAKLANLYAKGEITGLKAYYVDSLGSVKALTIEQKTGEIELPESIRLAFESLAGESLELIESLRGDH